jgi:hypothetical protein
MPEERKLATCSLPAFGKYVELADRLRALLRILGYGDVT